MSTWQEDIQADLAAAPADQPVAAPKNNDPVAPNQAAGTDKNVGPHGAGWVVELGGDLGFLQEARQEPLLEVLGLVFRVAALARQENLHGQGAA